MKQHIFSSRPGVVVVLTALVAIGSTIAAERSASTMASAATAFLGARTPEQKQQVSFAFGDERLHWHFIPTEMFPRKGLLIRDMTEPQRNAAHDLLKAGLSRPGYLAASSIME